MSDTSVTSHFCDMCRKCHLQVPRVTAARTARRVYLRIYEIQPTARHLQLTLLALDVARSRQVAQWRPIVPVVFVAPWEEAPLTRRTWFTADLHLGHANAIAFGHRPWDDVHRMNDGLVANINSCVLPADVLYVLGDFSCGITRDEALALRRRIACREVHLVPGNHDKDWTQREVAGAFVVEPPIAQLKVGPGQKVVLCHYPILDWPGMYHGSIHLHGHVHETPAYNEAMRAAGVRRYDVGVDANGWMPVSLEQVLGLFEGVDVEPRSEVRAMQLRMAGDLPEQAGHPDLPEWAGQPDLPDPPGQPLSDERVDVRACARTARS